MSSTVKAFLFIIGAGVVIGGISFVAISRNTDSLDPAMNMIPAKDIVATSTIDRGSDFDGDGVDEPGFESENEKADLPNEYTMAEISMHASAANCWTAIRGNVYDLTSFVGKHPGGKEILRVCGKDGTKAFTSQHGGSRSPENTLASFQIGVLKK
jgi:cytochrome b involved in lipid metabolism